MDDESAAIWEHLTRTQRNTLQAVTFLDEQLGKGGWDQPARLLIVLQNSGSGKVAYGFITFPLDFADVDDDPVVGLRSIVDIALKRAAEKRWVMPRSACNGAFFGVAFVTEGEITYLNTQTGEIVGPTEQRCIYLADRTGWLITSNRERGVAGLGFRIPNPDGGAVEGAGEDDVEIMRGLSDFLLAIGTAHPEAKVDLDAVAKVGHWNEPS